LPPAYSHPALTIDKSYTSTLLSMLMTLLGFGDLRVTRNEQAICQLNQRRAAFKRDLLLREAIVISQARVPRLCCQLL
jgi:hypothetical protein